MWYIFEVRAHAKSFITILAGVVLLYLWLCDRTDSCFGSVLCQKPRCRQVAVMTSSLILFLCGSLLLFWIALWADYYCFHALTGALSHRYLLAFLRAAGQSLSDNHSVGAELVELVRVLLHSFKALQHMALAGLHFIYAALLILKCSIRHPMLALICTYVYSRLFSFLQDAPAIEQWEEYDN